MSERQQLIDELEQAFRQVFRRLKDEMNHMLGEEMSRGEFFVLRHLRHGPQKVSVLAAEFGVSNSHITQLTDRLVKKGLARRHRSQADKRVVELMLTEEGTEVVATMEQKRLQYFRHKFDSFTTEEMSTLLRLFQKMSTQQPPERRDDRGAP
ncbi:MarR family winged helix-turn-helix transcriptional regulator [Desmospora profundinema]|uniref:DNA-binding MarR family transcriptional regulator n=1 Tax=Desmospora profundinema TaxID=1571184 RepID=A0ABU1IP50_9BACL|nr:MarR family transcriptional regulator [Desmospora profundinema]MDR6226560.1 DNA-binding MarR family transcriptional regulator [Desmospora profundinema]